MQLQLKIINKFAQKLRLTPQMKLAINLLQMPLVKLREFIKEEAEVNPLLDVEDVSLPLKQKEKSEEYSNIKSDKEFESDFSATDEFPPGQENYNFDDEARRNYRESLITTSPTLQEHLLRQLRVLTNSEDDLKIGELIIGNLDDNGYLRCPIEEIGESAKTDPSKVEEVLFLIQAFDPIGVGARDLRECLLLQLKTRGEEDSLPRQIVDKYLSCLAKKRYGYIAKKLSTSSEKVSVEMVKETMKEIASLEPKPGRSFSTERAVRLIPDATLRKNKQGYEVIFNDWELPQITINERYRQMIKQKDTPPDAKEYLRERLKAVYSLINGVKKRKETIQKIIEEIICVQKEFLDNGEPNFKPLTLEHIARRIGKHKSTVSRAIANKYVQTPWGILELRYFLSPGIRQGNGVLFSSKAVKSKIKDLIENENKEKPLTDREMVYCLQQSGISISRRTVAKYRNTLKVLSSNLRRE
jgi:RNA polymerase sigma-54 factor